ncbi:Flp family type IVb pilin [Methylobacterium sp. Leaf118]|uniref:Flp family type IVb pilin n=1 Tax=Methylobacterium sp. Leaf118 TaxID=2876562 RepID=UPI001E43332E|nr:Flp family type IVb pilin [Methylobacterium sp. Leaf118]
MRTLASVESVARLIRCLGASAARLRHDTEGATAIEYSLLTAIMAAAVVACMSVFGAAMKGMFDSIVGYYTLAQ